MQRFGRIDIRVNNACFGVVGAIEETSAKQVEHLFATDVFGLLNAARAVLPQRRGQRSGRIMNFSSVGGCASATSFGVYCATKFAVEGISGALSAGLAPLGIYATVVEPGYFRTTFLSDDSVVSAATVTGDYAATAGAVRALARSIDGRQPGDPTRLAAALIKLAHAQKPPVGLPLGADTVKKIEEKDRFVKTELAQWRELALSTGFPDAANS